MWKSARDSQQTSPHFSSIEKQFKMRLHRRKLLYRALVIWTALVCCCEFLRQYMYFSRTLTRLSWLQWTLDDSKLSLTSRIFRTMVSFLPAQFRHKMFVKSEPSPLEGVTKQSNEVTRNQVTWKKLKGSKISKSFKNCAKRFKTVKIN